MDNVKIARDVVWAYINMAMEDEHVGELQANCITIGILINKLAPYMDSNDSVALDMLDYFKSRLLEEIRALKDNIPIPRFFVYNIYCRSDIDLDELNELEEYDAPAPWDEYDESAWWEEWSNFDEWDI